MKQSSKCICMLNRPERIECDAERQRMCYIECIEKRQKQTRLIEGVFESPFLSIMPRASVSFACLLYKQNYPFTTRLCVTLAQHQMICDVICMIVVSSIPLSQLFSSILRRVRFLLSCGLSLPLSRSLDFLPSTLPAEKLPTRSGP